MIAPAIFAAAVVFITYVLLVYPVCVVVLSRRKAREVRKGPLVAPVTVLLPVRNGEKWIRGKLESILSLRYPRDLLETLVISDGSTDATASIARSFQAQGYPVRVLELAPGGKAKALNAGMEVAKGDILFFTDVRQTFDPGSLEALVQCFADPDVGVVSGELVIRKGETIEEENTGLYWRYEKWIRKALSRIDSIYGATGCIYAMRRELAVPLPPETLLDDVYLPLAGFFRGYRVVMEERAKAYDFPTALNAEFRRKLRTQAGVWQILRHYPALLLPRNRMLLHFMSHKIGRLLLPWALVAGFLSAFWLPDPWGLLAIAAQLSIYLLAIIDPVLPAASFIRRISSPARTFAVLMLAALLSPFALLRSTEAIWKETQIGTPRG